MRRLSAKVFALAFLNLALLAAVFLVFGHYQFGLHLDSFLFAPAHDRIMDVARSFGSDLAQTPVAERTSLAGRYTATYGADFYLFDNEGPQLAGRPVTLPPGVRDELLRRGPDAETDPNRPPPRGGPPGREGPPPRRPPRPPPPPGPAGPDAGLQTFQVSEGGLHWVGIRLPVLAPGETSRVRGTLFMAARSFWGTPLFFDFKPWLAAMAAAIGVSLLCWVPFLRGLTRSIGHMTAATGRIAEGDFGQHVSDTRGDELGRLSASINRMASRLGGYVTGQKRFLGDIAHELSAPIARIQFALGILEQRAEPAQAAAVGDLNEEVRHMSALVGELLSFSKAGIDAANAPLTATDVTEIARQAIARESAESMVMMEGATGVLAMASPNLLLRALSNLIRNSVRYAAGAGPITIAAVSHPGEVSMTVSDLGPGLPPEEMDRVFTPFYRPDASRSRDSGGAGLGLAIVRSCVEACGGTVRCRNRKPTGLEVEIRLRAA